MAISLDVLSSAMQQSALASSKPVPAPASGQATVVKAPAPAKAPEPPDLDAVVAQLNRMMQKMNNSLQFEVDRATGRTVVRVIDSNTNEILRQFPSEEVLAIAHAIESAKGALFNDLA